MTDKKELNIPNPAHYVGKFLMWNYEFPAIFLAVISTIAGGAGSAVLMDQSYDEIPDKQGTELEQSIILNHEKSLHDLNITQLTLNKAEADYELNQALDTVSKTEAQSVKSLKDKFLTQAQNSVFDLYLNGATKDGAAISEEVFDEKHTELFKQLSAHIKIKDEWNLNASIEAGALDECLAETTLSDSNNNLARYNDVKELNQCMVEYNNDGATVTILTAVLGTFASAFASIMLFGIGGRALSETPKRIPLTRKKKYLSKGSSRH